VSGRAAFVTGASGFVGGALATSLTEDGWSVRALVRSDSAAAKVEALGAEPIRGDLSSAAAIRGGAEGCEVAFHAAALPSEWGTRLEFELANVTGTANALSGCHAGGVRRFVHVGTEAACFAMKPLVSIDETAPLRPDSPVLYAATKAQAEQIVFAAGAEDFETVVVRPRLVWGRGDATVLPGFAEAVEQGRFTWAGDGRHLTSTTHIDNVVHGLRLAAERGRPGEAYFVSDGDPILFRDFITELLSTQDIEPPDRNTPGPVVRAAAIACESAWRLLPLPDTPPITRMAYFLIANETTVRISKAREELGYEPIRTLDEGMEELRNDASG
jgi:nucleoside-diphosphate-sugar epimerase